MHLQLELQWSANNDQSSFALTFLMQKTKFLTHRCKLCLLSHTPPSPPPSTNGACLQAAMGLTIIIIHLHVQCMCIYSKPGSLILNLSLSILACAVSPLKPQRCSSPFFSILNIIFLTFSKADGWHLSSQTMVQIFPQQSRLFDKIWLCLAIRHVVSLSILSELCNNIYMYHRKLQVIAYMQRLFNSSFPQLCVCLVASFKTLSCPF